MIPFAPFFSLSFLILLFVADCFLIFHPFAICQKRKQNPRGESPNVKKRWFLIRNLPSFDCRSYRVKAAIWFLPFVDFGRKFGIHQFGIYHLKTAIFYFVICFAISLLWDLPSEISHLLICHSILLFVDISICLLKFAIC